MYVKSVTIELSTRIGHCQKLDVTLMVFVLLWQTVIHTQ